MTEKGFRRAQKGGLGALLSISDALKSVEVPGF